MPELRKSCKQELLMANCKAMDYSQLEEVRSIFAQIANVEERIAFLDKIALVKNLQERSESLRRFLSGCSLEGQCAIKQFIALDQGRQLQSASEEHWASLYDILVPLDQFYRPLGGVIGYQAEVMRLIACEPSRELVCYHSPAFEEISAPTPQVLQAIEWGIEALAFTAEIYPLGGAADRLHLVDESSGVELPAAKLGFCGRSMLELLIRDLRAREKLYFERFGIWLTTPIAIMTSQEKSNHDHVVQLCEENNWFGRPKESIRFFTQPLVPAVDENGQWHWVGPFKPLLKPGGHGAIWKLAKDEGIFAWLQTLGRTKALVRQINNPAAGIDYGLLAFCGIGWKKDMTFGFASCPRLLESAEGMNVLAEKADGEIVLTNVEYCDFTKFGIEDKPLVDGQPYSRFSSNTNILFVDLQAVSAAVEQTPFPGLLINLKPSQIPCPQNGRREAKVGRLESTMQNLADVFSEPKRQPLRTEKTFATYNQRSKTISVAKKAYIPGKSLLETPEQCFYEMLLENRDLLQSCGFDLPPIEAIEEHLQFGPSSLFCYDRSLGPLYADIRRKLKLGRLSFGSELVIDAADVQICDLIVEGSLRIVSDFPHMQGKCRLRNVKVVNRGVDWQNSSPFWKMNLCRRESVLIELRGSGEFIAEDIVIEGAHHWVIEDGQRFVLEPRFSQAKQFCNWLKRFG